LTPAKRRSTPGSGAGDLSSASPGSASSSTTRQTQSPPLAVTRGFNVDPAAQEALCRLGFSAAAACHALERCDGRLDDAGAWLVDGANADEILAAELQAQADDDAHDLVEGCVARITGLRTAVQLNGLMVAVLVWDEIAERWIVETPDGTRKAIRPRNLERVQDPDLVHDDSVQPGGAGPVPRSSSSACPAARPQDDALAGFEVDDDLREVLASLSPMQVRELLGGGGAQASSASSQRFAPPPRRPPRSAEGELRAAGQATVGKYGASLPELNPHELQRRWEAEEERWQLREAEQLSQAQALEEREAEFELMREVWRSQAEAEVERLRELESQRAALETDARQRSAVPPSDCAGGARAEAAECEADNVELQLLQAELLSMSQELEERRKLAEEAAQEERERQASLQALSQRHAAELAECEAELRRAAVEAAAAQEEPPRHELAAAAAASAAEGADMEAVAATAANSADVEAQRAELQALQEEVQRAARDLAEQREEARLQAEDRELKLLEQQLVQRRIEDNLREESAKVERQRRAMLALQASAVKMMDGSSENRGGFQKDEKFGCAMAKLDVTDDGVEQAESAAGSDAEDAESEVWEVDWNEWSRTHQCDVSDVDEVDDRPPHAEEEHSRPEGAVAAGSAGSSEEAAADNAALPMSPVRQTVRLAPGHSPEDSEADSSFQDQSSPARATEAASPETPGAQQLSDPGAATPPPRGMPA